MTSAPFSADTRHGDPAILGWSFRKSFPIAATTAALMLLVQPMIMLLYGLSLKTGSRNLMIFPRDPDISALYMGTQIFVLLISMVLTVVIASMMFGYLQSKRSLDLFHSLPITRGSLFFGKYLAGLALISLPLILLCVLNGIIAPSFGLNLGETDNGIKVSGILLVTRLVRDLLSALLLQTAAYTLTCFVFINTGTTFDSIISMIAVNVVYPVLMFFITMFLNQRLYGFNHMLEAETYMLLSPFARMMATVGLELPLWVLIWWVVLIAGLLVLSVFQYKRRKSEDTGNAYTFPVLKVLFKITIPFAAGLSLSGSFTAIFNSEWVLLISFLMGATVAYVIVEAFVSRGFKNIIRGGVPLLVTFALFLGMYGSVSLGGFGYETRIPARDQIKSVTISELDAGAAAFTKYGYGKEIVLSEQKSIDAFHALHVRLANAVRDLRRVQGFGPTAALVSPENYKKSVLNTDLMEYVSYQPVSYEFHLKNGTSLKRTYQVREQDFPDLFGEVILLPEYRMKSHPLLSEEASADGWTQLSLHPALGIQLDPIKTLTMTKTQSKELVEAARADLLAETAQQAASSEPPLGFFSVSQESGDWGYKDTGEIPVKPHYKNLAAFFEKYDWSRYFENQFPEGTVALVVKDGAKFLDVHRGYLPYNTGSLDLFAGKDYGQAFETAVSDDPVLIQALVGEARFPEVYPADGMFVMLAYKTSAYTQNSRIFYIPKERIPAAALALDYRKMSYEELPLSPQNYYEEWEFGPPQSESSESQVVSQAPGETAYIGD